MQPGFPPLSSGSSSSKHYMTYQKDSGSHIQNFGSHGLFQVRPHPNNPSSGMDAGHLAHAIENHDGDDVNIESVAVREGWDLLLGDPSPTASANGGIWDASHQSISQPSDRGITTSLYPQPTSDPNDGTGWNLLHPFTEQPGSTLTSSEYNLSWPSVPQYECPECNAVFPHQSYLERHRQSCGGQTLFQNNAHQKNSTWRTDSEIDWPSNDAQSVSWSGLCRKELSLQRDLQQQGCTSQAHNELQCSFCPEKFSDPLSLEEHHRIHTEETVHWRVVCQKDFGQQAFLKSDQSREHTDKVRFACSFCPVTFFHEEYLERHHHIHMWEGKFGCPECPKIFNKWRYLRQHLRVHTGEKPYECSHCHKKFKRAGNLNVHLQTHSTVRDVFHCPICTLSYLSEGSLKRHLQSHAHE